MYRRSILLLLFLLAVYHVNGYPITYDTIDIVNLKIDRKKGKLVVKRKILEPLPYTFNIKKNRDPKDTSITLREGIDSLRNVINLYAGIDSVQQANLLKILKDTSLTEHTFKINTSAGVDTSNSVIPPPSPPVTTVYQPSYLLWANNIPLLPVILAILVIGLFIWGVLEWNAKQKSRREHKQEFGSKLIKLLSAHFKNGYGYWSSKDPDQLIAGLAKNKKELEYELHQLRQHESQLRKELSEKEGIINDHSSEIDKLKNELARLPGEIEKEFNYQQEVEKKRINSLCEQMINKKDLFISSLRGLDENQAKKELLRFSLAYAETAVAVLDEIKGKISENGKKNIKLLNGDNASFLETFDRHTPENAIDKEYILMAKLLSDYGIESIDDVYFNGYKYQQKN